MKSTIRIIAIIILASATQAYAQAVPFLNYPVSAQALGMGGVGTAFISDNATATIANPAQLGIFSLNAKANASTDIAGWLEPGASMDASAISVGAGLNQFWKELPFTTVAGIGYSNISYSYVPPGPLSGPYVIPGREIDASNSLTVALGLDYFVALGFGYTLKLIHSRDPSYPVNQTGQDLGVILQVPVTKLIRKARETRNGVKPTFDLSFGYAMRNFGKYVRYPYTPLPTEADLGLSADGGLSSRYAGMTWHWLSLSWSSEAANAPFRLDSVIEYIGHFATFSDTAWGYAPRYHPGLGNFNPWQNLILGKASATVGLRKGGQIGLAEFIYIRAGSITDAGQTTYSTFGWGLDLDGLAKCLVFFRWLDPNAPVAKFLLDHLDLQYDYSRAYGGIYQGEPFEDLNLVVR